MRSFRLLLAIPALLVALGIAVAEETKAPKAIPDGEISLYPGSVFEVPVPPPVADNATDPGEAPLPPRPRHLPPVIPHGIADFLPLTRGSNSCIDCHAVEKKVEGEATPIPQSHYVDLRNAPGKVGPKVAGARYNCVACHVAQTQAKPLVGNSMDGN